MVEWGFKCEFALQKFRSADVAYGSLADMAAALWNVRFTPDRT
jgi:hypothetical protein